MAIVEGLGYALAWVPFLAGRRPRAPSPRSISFGETAAEFRRVFRHEPTIDALVRLADDVLMAPDPTPQTVLRLAQRMSPATLSR